MAKGKSRNTPKGNPNSKGNVSKQEYVQNLINKPHEITADEFREYQALKASVKENGDFDYTAYLTEVKAKIDSDFADAKAEKYKELENIALDVGNEILLKNNELSNQRDNLQKEIKELSATRDNISGEVKKRLDDADTQAAQIKKKAEIDASTTLKDRENKLKSREDALSIKESEVEDKSGELDRKIRRIDIQKDRLVAKEQEYNDSNPEALKQLQAEIEIKDRNFEDLKVEYTALLEKEQQHRLHQAVVGDKTAEELSQENIQMQKTIDELTEKCNQYTDYQLEQMAKAADEKPILEERIKELELAARDDNSKIVRLENSERELENVRAQIDLIKTLNDHLAQELKNSKKALESRDGNVCPQLMEIDISAESDDVLKKYNERSEYAEECEDISLYDIVDHVKDYAETKGLYYSAEDLRAFVAGLASSRIAILQGLSGTGKTTLPRIFAEALYTENRRVPVQSSWRDRNELLGYYNDFNKKFTARDFTKYLYEAGLPSYIETPYFIVLDEMNISRVEYYFADFLSLLEEPDMEKWQLPLTETDLRSLPTELTQEQIDSLSNDWNGVDWFLNAYDHGKLKDLDDDKKLQVIQMAERAADEYSDFSKFLNGPKNLLSGRILRVPSNVWFIGTANRDESTFEISDKVYDRAQVLNFAPAKEPRQKCQPVTTTLYVSNEHLHTLFQEAKNSYNFDYSKNEQIALIEDCLQEQFDVAFGNRMGKQINDFVRVYIAAGCDPSSKRNTNLEKQLTLEAIDYQIANKVLRKIEYKDATDTTRYEELLGLLDGLPRCRKIVNNKIKEH